MNYSGVSQLDLSTPSQAYAVEVGLNSSIRGGFFHFEIVRAFESGAYVDAFLDQLTRHGIRFVREPESRYVTPENGLITDLGLL